MIGRPFSLYGQYYANIYIHFEPVGYSINHERKLPKQSAQELYHAKLSQRQSPDEYVTPIVPPYIKKDTSEQKRWLQKFPDRLNFAPEDFHDERALQELLYPDEVAISSHLAAKNGDLATLKKFSPLELTKKDHNGWQPIHEVSFK